MQAPPVIPERILQRVLTIARVDGLGVVWVSAASAVILVLQGAWGAASAAGLVFLAGWGELHGRHELLRGRIGGLTWLIGAQLALLAIILTYAWYRWNHFDAARLWAELPGFLQAHVNRKFIEAGLDPEWHRSELLRLTHELTCLTLAIVTLVYQGGLTLWYLRSRDRVRQALLASP